MAPLCKCELIKVFWMPNLEKAERILIAIVMLCDDPPFAEIRMTQEKDRIFHFYPLTDLNFLEQTVQQLARDIKHRVSLARVRDRSTGGFPNTLQLSMPTALLSDNPAADFERLAKRYLVTPRLPAGSIGEGALKDKGKDERRRLHGRMVKTFKHDHVWKHMLKPISMRDYVPELRTKIDCGYLTQPRADGELQFKMFHAIAVSDRDSVASLVNSYPAFKKAIGNEMHAEPVLFAITRDWAVIGDEDVSAFDALNNTGINHLRVADLPRFARQAREDLGLLYM